MPSRQLVIFDFDETVVSVSTVPQLLKIIPPHKRPPKYDLAKLGWVEYANGIYKELQSMGYSLESLSDFISSLPPNPGMLQLIEKLWCSKDPKYEIIMISDCHRFFLVNWLKKYNIYNCFTSIYCNPTVINDCGELVASDYHCVECPYSGRNLCKRRLIEQFLSLQRDLCISYDRVIYVGNGRNDFCPSLDMSRCDLMCARKDDILEEQLKKNQKKFKLKPEIFYWDNGYELIAKLERKKGH